MPYGPEEWTAEDYASSDACPHPSFNIHDDWEGHFKDSGGYSISPPAICTSCGLIFEAGAVAREVWPFFDLASP